MLKFNFIHGSIFIFFCFIFIIIKKEQRKIKIEPRIKLNYNTYGRGTVVFNLRAGAKDHIQALINNYPAKSRGISTDTGDIPQD